MSKKLLNEKGFSLAEVMVAAGISGVVALGSMKIAENSQKGMRNMATKAAVNNYLNYKIVSVLSDANACRNGFDLNDNGVAGEAADIVTITPGGADVNINRIISPTGNVLLEVDSIVPSTSGEYDVDTLTISRDTDTSCTLTIDLSRNDSAGSAKKIGGRHKREVIALGCSFDDANASEMLSCSSQGTGQLGNWDFNNGANPWLSNPTGNAVIGNYVASPSVTPPARLVIMRDDPMTQDWNGSEEGIALPANYAIRWGNEGSITDGVGLVGTAADCLSFKTATDASHLTSCQSTGTTLENALRVNGPSILNGAVTGDPAAPNNGLLSVGAGLNVAGNAVVNGTISGDPSAPNSGTLNVGSGINVTGNASVSGNSTLANLTVTGSSNLSSLDVSGTSVLNDVNINGVLTSNAASTFGSTSVFNNTASFYGTINQGLGQTANLQTVYANQYLYYSDRRLKEGIHPLENKDLENLLELEPVSYYWRNKNVGTQREFGLIAQEVERIFPNLVRESDGGIKTVNYGGLISPLIGAVQELKAENEELRKENEEIKARLDRIERALAQEK